MKRSASAPTSGSRDREIGLTTASCGMGEMKILDCHGDSLGKFKS